MHNSFASLQHNSIRPIREKKIEKKIGSIVGNIEHMVIVMTSFFVQKAHKGNGLVWSKFDDKIKVQNLPI